MRILVMHATAKLIGGAEAVYLYGSQALSRRGHQVIWMNVGENQIAQALDEPVYSPYHPPVGGVQENYRVLAGLLYSQSAVHTARQIVQEQAPDIAHAHIIRRSLSPAVVLPLKRQGIPVVQTVHDYHLICPQGVFLSHGQVCQACRGRRYDHCITKRCAQDGSLVKSTLLAAGNYVADYVYNYASLIDRFICPSQFMYDTMAEFGFPKEKLVVLHNAYFFTPREVSTQPSVRDRILFIGRLSHEKGVDLLIRAAVGLNIAVQIVGDGDDRPSLEHLAKEVGASNVEFLGFLPHERLADLYAHSYASVLPSRCYENGPLTILEAYAHGSPVIGANIGGIPEFILPGQTGHLFKAHDAQDLHRVLKESLAQPLAMEQMGQRAYAYVKEYFSPDRYVDGLERIFAEVRR